MSKKYLQTQAEKENLKSVILDILKERPNTYIAKSELITRTGMNERKVRAEIEKIANYYPIRATAGRKGYALIWFDENSDIEQLKATIQEAFLQSCEIQNRIDSLKARLKPLIATMRVTALQLQAKGVNIEDE